MQTWTAKRPTPSFYLLTLLAQRRRSAHGSDVNHLRGLLGSLLTAIAVTAVPGRRQGLHELFGRMLRLAPPRQLLAHGCARAALCVALWYVACHMMVAREIGTGWPLVIVGTAVMAWGVILAVR